MRIGNDYRDVVNVFKLDDLRVSEIMTPRTKITCLDVNDPLYKHLEVIAEKQYTCYVVAEEDLEHFDAEAVCIIKHQKRALHIKSYCSAENALRFGHKTKNCLLYTSLICAIGFISKLFFPFCKMSSAHIVLS